MLALRWHGARDVRLDDVAEPTLTGLVDTLVRVELCGICGTDVAEVRSGPQMIHRGPHPLSGQAPPVTMGHELIGRVLSQADDPAQRLESGQRVTADACLRCGRCSACLRGDYHRCRLGGSIGLHLDGAFAAHVALPSYLLVPVPDAVDDLSAAQTEPFAVALHGLDRAEVQPGDDVLVFGFGPIGASSALIARAIGARPHVVEVNQERRQVAEHLGLSTIDPGDDLPRRVRRSLGDGGPQVVIESTGAPQVLPLAVDCAMRGGRIAVLGMAKDPIAIDFRRLTLFERSLVGSLGYRFDLSRVLGLMEDGLIDAGALVGQVIPLDAAADELMAQADHTPTAIKTLVSVG